MPKLPDFSELSKKLDLQGLLDSVKSAVSGIGTPPKAPEGDEVAAKFVEVITLVQTLITTHAEQAKTIASVHQKLNSLYKDIQAIQQGTSATETTSKPLPEQEAQNPAQTKTKTKTSTKEKK